MTATTPNIPAIYVREALYEFRRLLRTRAFSFSVMGFPVLFYLFFGILLNHGQHFGPVSVAKYLLGSYAVFGAVGASLFGVGVALANELGNGWLELKRASPMPPLALLVAKCISAMAFTLIITAVLLVFATRMGGVTLTGNELLHVLLLPVLGAVPFASMGLLVASLVPSNAAPGIANMIYLPMSFCGGLWLPVDALPKFMQHFAQLLPTYHLAQLVESSLGYPSHGSPLGHWSALAAFTCIMLGCAWIAFARREQNA